MSDCKFCLKFCATQRSLTCHEKFCGLNPEKQISWLEKNNHTRKRSNQHIKSVQTGIPVIVSLDTRNKLSVTHTGVKWTEERRVNHSSIMKEVVKNNPSSYSSSNRGRTKKIEKYGLVFQGTWELEYYEWCLENNINIVRCTEWFPYQWNGERKYNPDFYLPDKDLYIEIKGYETDRDRAKWRDFPKNLRVIKKKEIEEIKGRKLNGRAVDSHGIS